MTTEQPATTMIVTEQPIVFEQPIEAEQPIVFEQPIEAGQPIVYKEPVEAESIEVESIVVE